MSPLSFFVTYRTIRRASQESWTSLMWRTSPRADRDELLRQAQGRLRGDLLGGVERDHAAEVLADPHLVGPDGLPPVSSVPPRRAVRGRSHAASVAGSRGARSRRDPAVGDEGRMGQRHERGPLLLVALGDHLDLALREAGEPGLGAVPAQATGSSSARGRSSSRRPTSRWSAAARSARPRGRRRRRASTRTRRTPRGRRPRVSARTSSCCSAVPSLRTRRRRACRPAPGLRSGPGT